MGEGEISESKGIEMRIQLKILILAAILLSAHAKTAYAQTVIRMELLCGSINATNIKNLFDVWSRNIDKVIHLKLSIDWPNESVNFEQSDYKRLIFWNENAEYLFPDKAYSYQHGSWIVNGYFIARSGGVHQGVISIAFEKIADTAVLLNPSVIEIPARGSTCR